MANTHTYKLVLVGDGGVGKTTWLKKLRTQCFEKKYVPTLGVEVHPIHLKTNEGTFAFNVWDTAGQEKFGGLRDGYYIQGKCALIMYAVDQKGSCDNVSIWERDVRRVCGDIPLAVIGNKRELPWKKEYEGPLASFGMSIKEGEELWAPLLYVARQLTGNSSLYLVN